MRMMGANYIVYGALVDPDDIDRTEFAVMVSESEHLSEWLDGLDGPHTPDNIWKAAGDYIGSNMDKGPLALVADAIGHAEIESYGGSELRGVDAGNWDSDMRVIGLASQNLLPWSTPSYDRSWSDMTAEKVDELVGGMLSKIMEEAPRLEVYSMSFAWYE